MDLGCYPVSLARYLFGQYVTITGSAEFVLPRGEGENVFDSYAESHVTFADGVTGLIKTSNNVDPLKWSFVVTCEGGSIELSNLWDESIEQQFIALTPLDGDTPARKILIPCDVNFYTLEIDTVNECIIVGRVQPDAPAMDWEDSVENMRFLDAWRDAVGLRYPVDTIVLL